MSNASKPHVTERGRIMTLTPPDKPQADNRYNQKHAAKVTLPGGRQQNDVRSLAVDKQDRVYCATWRGLFLVDQQFEADVSMDELPPEWTPPVTSERIGEDDFDYDIKEVRMLPGETLFVVTRSEVVYRLDGDDTWHYLWKDSDANGYGAVMSAWPLGADQPGFEFETSTPIFMATSRRGAGIVQNGVWTQMDGVEELGSIIRMDPAIDGVWVSGSLGAAKVLSDGTIDTLIVIGTQVRRAVTNGDSTWLATGDGIYIVGPGGIAGKLADFKAPCDDIHDLFISEDNELWAATSRGVWRKVQGESRMHYYNGLRYIPHSYCRTVARTSKGSVWVATAAGLAHLAELPQTLEEKAARFEYRIRKRHLRLDGYVTSSRLTKQGDLSTNVPMPSDNDGLWTAMYMAAEAYRYAVTQSDEAKAYAKQAYDAIERLEEVTTIPGFPTKAIITPDDPIQHQTKIGWLPSADGKWLWKADCSSDEIVGHLYGYSLYYDLVADEAEKQRVAALVDRIMGHILDNGYLLIGPDGEHTQWGFWSPEILNGRWKSQRGLNSLEILSHLRAAYHITGRERYMDAYLNLVEEHGYAENVRRQKVDTPGHVNHSDDELAFLSYYPLIKYEDDPALREIYLDSLDHNWQMERIERNPLWNIMYGVLSGEHCDLEESVRTLREIPMDLITWNVDNSIRGDVSFDAVAGRFGELKTIGVLPYDELPARKWNGNPRRAVEGGNGYGEDDGTYYLLPYWMGRYYGLIRVDD